MLDQAAHFVQSNLMASAGIIGLAVEMALRLVKSEKPLSIALGVAAAARKIADLCKSVADFLDKVLPQKLK